MRPTSPTTPEERRVIRWVFGPLFVLAVLFLAATVWKRSRDCAASCAAEGFSGSELRLRGGGRFEMHVECVCTGATQRDPANAME
jgi:hypothetical protein